MYGTQTQHIDIEAVGTQYKPYYRNEVWHNSIDYLQKWSSYLREDLAELIHENMEEKEEVKTRWGFLKRGHNIRGGFPCWQHWISDAPGHNPEAYWPEQGKEFNWHWPLQRGVSISQHWILSIKSFRAIEVKLFTYFDPPGQSPGW